MKERRLLLSGLMMMVLLPGVRPSLAQTQHRASDTFYWRLDAGTTYHLGDTEKSPFNLNLDNWEAGWPYPLMIHLEIGYQFTSSTQLGIGYQAGSYPLVEVYGAEVPENTDDPKAARHTISLLWRRLIEDAPVRDVLPFLPPDALPFVSLGLQGTFGGPRASWGPGFGIGLDFLAGPQISGIVEWRHYLSLPDDALDGRDDNGFGPFDVLGRFSIGVKWTFKKAGS